MKAPRNARKNVKTKNEDRYGVAVQILLDLDIVETIEEAEELVESKKQFIDVAKLENVGVKVDNIKEMVRNFYGINGNKGKTQLDKDSGILSSLKKAYAQGYNFDPKKFLGRKLFGEDKEDKEKLSSDQNFIPSKTSAVPQQKLIPDPWEDSDIPPEAPKPTNKLGLLTDIRESVQGILGLLETKQDALRDAAEKERIAAENAEREKEEEDLEEKGDDDDGGGALEKAAAPVKSFLEKIGSFLTKFVLAKTVFALFEWMQKPGNRKKLDNLVEFLVDWAPVFLTGFLLFATPLVPMITGFVAVVGGMIAKMALAAVGVAGFIKAHPIAALTIAGVTGLIFAANALGKKDKKDQVGQGNNSIDKNPNRGDGDLDDTSTIDETSSTTSEQYTKVAGEKFDPKKPTENQKQAIQLKDMMTESRQGFNKGGQVPGRGANKDTVPAMLTPGEFVMSRDAVDQWGVSTLEGMNAAAGGTNRPTIRGGYNEGGLVNRIQPEDLIHVNNERKLQGLPPLDKLTYAAGVVPSVAKGPGPKTSEYTDTHTDYETMTRTITKTINGKTTRESFKLSNEESSELLKEQGLPSMTLADGSIVVDSASFNYDKGIEALQSWRVQMAEENPKALAEFNALPDVIEMDQRIADGSLREEIVGGSRMHKKGTKENLMQKNMNRIEQMDGGEGVKLMNFNGGGLVQYLNRGGLVEDYKALKLERSRLQRDPDGRLTGKNRKKWNQLSKEMDTLAKQIISYDKSTSTNKKTTNNKKSKKGGGFGLKRMIGGAADMATGHMFDFDKRSGGGLLRKTAKAGARVAGGTADMLTGNLFDFDKRSGGGLLRKTASAVGGLFGGRDKPRRTQSSRNIRPSQDPNSLRYKQIQALRNSAEGNMNKGTITKEQYTKVAGERFDPKKPTENQKQAIQLKDMMTESRRGKDRQLGPDTMGSKRMKVTIPEPRVKKRGGSSSRAITLPAINQSSGASSSSSSLPSPKEQVPDLPISTNPTRRMNRAIMGLGG